MREVEFLPSWYPALRWRKRAVWIQLGATVGVVLVLAGMTIARRIDERRQQGVAAVYAGRIKQYAPALARLDQLHAQQRELRQRERLAALTGLQLDPTRLLNLLEDAMPAKVALTDLSLQAVASQASSDAQRRLSVRVVGVAPSDVEVVTLMTNLGKVKFFEEVAMDYTREHTAVTATSQATREFALTFAVDLTAAPSANGK